jgi:hypothetical protein
MVIVFNHSPPHRQNRPLQVLAEITPSFDDLRQHATIRVCKVGQYLCPLLLRKRWNPHCQRIKIRLTSNLSPVYPAIRNSRQTASMSA